MARRPPSGRFCKTISPPWARIALRASLAKPSTLLLTAGVAGLVGVWVGGRSGSRAAEANASGSEAKASLAGIVLGLIWRYALRGLPVMLDHYRAASNKRVA